MTANMTNPNEKLLYSYLEARELLGGVAKSTFAMWIAKGILVPVKIGPRRCMIKHEDLIALASGTTAPAELQPAPAPCPFKVGDWVYHLTCKPEERGTVEQVFTEAVATRWEGGTVSTDEFEAIRKVENTAAKPCRVDVDLLIYERDGLLDEVSRLKTEAKERANAYSQNMQAVKDELAEAKRQATWWESVNKSTTFREKAEQRERGKAEAKLADIAAINRVAEIVNARPEGSEDWHFQGLVADVLKGGVSA